MLACYSWCTLSSKPNDGVSMCYKVKSGGGSTTLFGCFVLNQNYWCNAPPRSAHAFKNWMSVWRAWTKAKKKWPQCKSHMIVKNFTMMHEPPSDPMVIHSSAVACIGLLIASPLALMQAATTSHGCCAVAVAAAGHTHCGHCHSGFCWTGSTWWVCGVPMQFHCCQMHMSCSQVAAPW